ncbi:MAG: glucose-6-phosphate dehydrogenase, partial [Anaerolineae bacterium]|nr:glucose-6-phosphate dehydrogenase [Anaerolineae bacterium]
MSPVDFNRSGIRQVPDPCVVVIFGASGDLTRRKLMPSLFSLVCEKLLPDQFSVVGVARTEMDNDTFRQKIHEGIDSHGRLKPTDCDRWADFANNIHYHQGEYDDAATYDGLCALLGQIDEQVGGGCNILFYLSTPPVLYAPIIKQLGQAGLAVEPDGHWRRIIIEKPFGHDLASAMELNHDVHHVFHEDQVYRIDHYLGKETVQNLLVFRFA